MKLFPKLALSVSALSIATITCLTLSFYFTQQRSLRQQMDQERHAILNNLVHISQESFLTNDDLLLVKYTGWLQKWNPALISASVVSLGGEVIAHSEPSRIGKPNSDWDSASSEVLLLTEPVRMGNHTIATASVEYSQRYYDEWLRSQLLLLQRRVGQVALVVFLGGMLLSFLMALSWTRPIRSLVHAAGRIGEGKYDLELSATDRRRDELGFLAQAFKDMAGRLQELDGLKEDFVSAVTHELRSPLGAIESYLNLIAEELKNGVGEEAWDLYLERLRLNTQRLSRFVNNLLDVAALERGKVHLQAQPTDLSALITDVVSLYGAQLNENKLELQLHIPRNLPQAVVDSEKIRQVTINLLSNAIKFTPTGGRIDVTLEHLRKERILRLAVKDTGIGISAQDQQKIFNKFEQVRNGRPHIKGPKGTGLGLSITKAIIELHGGSIGVQSRPNEGSCFFVTLPLASEFFAQQVPALPMSSHYEEGVL